jgi:hypothetical protein
VASLPVKYPIYIVSKGRFQNPKTANIFLKNKIPFKILIEPQEFSDYKRFLGHVVYIDLNIGMYSVFFTTVEMLSKQELINEANKFKIELKLMLASGEINVKK